MQIQVECFPEAATALGTLDVSGALHGERDGAPMADWANYVSVSIDVILGVRSSVLQLCRRGNRELQGA